MDSSGYNVQAAAQPAIIEADLTYTEDGFFENMQVVVGADGVIQQVGMLDLQPTMVLKGEALLPGMVNAHSHAFQRGLRGSAEWFRSREETFWTWRDAMYELVGYLDVERFTNLCRVAFEEMLRGGITTVGEFHYLRHADETGGYEFDQAILEAARQAGIRIVLLPAYYAHGGIGQPLRGAQKLFRTDSIESYRAQLERLRRLVDPQREHLGCCAHSIRAASPIEMAAVHALAAEWDMVLHLHAEEQPAEIDACVEAYGKSPVELLLDRGVIDGRTTLVHCTHTPRRVLKRVGKTGATVCICPTTEANLGDGIPDLEEYAAHYDMALGTDSNVRVSMTEEMRWLEYGQRLRHQRRGVLDGGRGDCAAGLFRSATVGGARSLGIPAGAIAPGSVADFFVVDKSGLSLLGSTAETLLASIVFGAGRSCVTRVCVGGHWRNWP